MKQVEAGPTGVFTPNCQRDWHRVPKHLVQAALEVIPKNKTIVDIGSGPGVLMNTLRKHGYLAWGLEGTPGIEGRASNVFEHDLTKPLSDEQKRMYSADWGLCIEVGEHIPAEFFGQLISNIKGLVKEYLILTWADTQGEKYDKRVGHVNCLSQVAVAAAFAHRGVFVDDEKTQAVREIVGDARFNQRQRIMVLRVG